MHVFIDTNIFLNFYHFTSDDLDALNSVFVSHKEGSTHVHLTDQVCNEFRRNREGKLRDALKQFRTFNLSAQLPYFMKTYEEYATLQDLGKKFKKHAKAISDKADTDILAMNLPADHLTNDIFGKSKILKTTAKIYDAARRRVDVGNPPGKPGSIGDAINWLLLLEHVPDEEPLFIVTEDSDFYSQFDDKAISPFLKHEWGQTKQSAVKAYRTLNEFLDEHYDGVHVSYDEEKKNLVDALESCRSFVATHSVVTKLEKYKYYSLQEAKAILDALQANDQFRMIRGDSDVEAFLKAALLPHQDKLKDPEHAKYVAELVADDEDDEIDF